jgi:hypothetical protein
LYSAYDDKFILCRGYAYSFWMTIELAAPPPLQIAAAPNCPDLRRWVKVTTIREPEELGKRG